MKKIKAPFTAEQLCLMHIANFPYMDKLWRKGEENERYIMADHHDDESKSDYAAQGRYPYSVALTAQKLNTIWAAEKENRTSFKVEATTDPQDEVKAELAGLRLKNIETTSGLKYIEGDSFISGTGVAFGVISIDSFDNLGGASDSKKIRFVKAPAEVSVAVSGAAAALVYGVDVYSNATANLVVSGSSVGVKVGKLQEADEERTGFYWVSLEK